MQMTLTTRLAFGALSALACADEQPTSPDARSAFAAEPSLSSAAHSRANKPTIVFLQQYPTSLGTSLTFEENFAYIDPPKFRDVFASDVPERETRVMAATQKPLFGGILSQAPAAAAWRTIPSWYLVTQDDQGIHPDLQRFHAARMHARVSEIHASHAVFISHPRAVAKLIVEAAETVSNQAHIGHTGIPITSKEATASR